MLRMPLVASALLLMMPQIAVAEFPRPEALPQQKKLPDPLVAMDGAKVQTPQAWEEERKPELKALFEHYMYGRYPAKPDKVTARVLFEHADLESVGLVSEYELTFGPPEWPKIYLLVVVPFSSKAPAPCFVGANFGGNHLLIEDERVRVPTTWMPDRYPGVVDNRATAAGRGAQRDTWPLADIAARGYAVATFYCGDVQPDRPGVNEGMREIARDISGPADEDQTATIMWWAWGIHRVIDFLETQKDIDANRIAVVGHSRLGKTALLAGAIDERIALTVANQAGCGGSGPSRHNDPNAESVARITRAFPHWFCGNFVKFGEDTSRLPFDQHALVALCVPRPVLFTAAAEDLWANPSGQFEMLKAATPVYELLGAEGLEAANMPEPDAPLIDSRLGYWIRGGKHAMTPADWKVYMNFADQWLK